MKQAVLQIDTATLQTTSLSMPKAIFVADHGKTWQVRMGGRAPERFTSPVALACAFDLDGDELLHRAAILDGWRPRQVLIHRSADGVQEKRDLLFADETGQVWRAEQWLAGKPGFMASGATAEDRWYVLGVDEYLERLDTIITYCTVMGGARNNLAHPPKPILVPSLDDLDRQISALRALATKERDRLRSFLAAVPVVEPTIRAES